MSLVGEQAMEKWTKSYSELIFRPSPATDSPPGNAPHVRGRGGGVGWLDGEIRWLRWEFYAKSWTKISTQYILNRKISWHGSYDALLEYWGFKNRGNLILLSAISLLRRERETSGWSFLTVCSYSIDVVVCYFFYPSSLIQLSPIWITIINIGFSSSEWSLTNAIGLRYDATICYFSSGELQMYCMLGFHNYVQQVTTK